MKLLVRKECQERSRSGEYAVEHNIPSSQTAPARRFGCLLGGLGLCLWLCGRLVFLLWWVEDRPAHHRMSLGSCLILLYHFGVNDTGDVHTWLCLSLTRRTCQPPESQPLSPQRYGGYLGESVWGLGGRDQEVCERAG